MTRFIAVVLWFGMTGAAAAEAVTLYAAGSLRAAMNEMASAFEAGGGGPVAGTFGSSGQLRERIVDGEAAHVFAANNMAHAEAVMRAGKSGPVVLFARNPLCAIAREKLKLTSANLLDTMLKPAIRLATPTPIADPAGDDAIDMFKLADKVKPGARDKLETKAIHPTGGASAEQPPAGRNLYAWFFEKDRVDVFLTYCSLALAARAAMPELRAVEAPQPLSVGADYGLVVLKDAPAAAYRFALFVLSVDGQRILERYSFSPPALPGDAGK